MSEPLKEVLIVGYGAVGAIYAMILKRGGQARVSAVARSNFEAAQKDGITFQSMKYGDIPNWRPDRLFRSVSDALVQPYSYVIVATKALPEITPTSVLLAPFLSEKNPFPQPTYVLLQNGLGVEGDLYQAAAKLGKGEPRVISAAVSIGVNLLSPSVVEHSDFDRLSFGMYKGGVYTDTSYRPGDLEELNCLAEMLRAGGSDIDVVPEIQRVKFKKNLWNIGFSTFATLTRYPLPAIYREPGVPERVVPSIRAILLEALAVGRAIGIDEAALPAEVVESTMRGSATLYSRPDSKHKASMLLDLETGKPLEIEVIVGELVRKAKEFNVDIPRIETLYALLIVIQGQLLKKPDAPTAQPSAL